MKHGTHRDVLSQQGVDSVGCYEGGDGAPVGEGGGDGVVHLREGHEAEAEALVQLEDLRIGLLVSLAQDAANRIAALIFWHLGGGRGRGRVRWGKEKMVVICVIQNKTSAF